MHVLRVYYVCVYSGQMMVKWSNLNPQELIQNLEKTPGGVSFTAAHMKEIMNRVRHLPQ
jgi:hypothetical protein